MELKNLTGQDIAKMEECVAAWRAMTYAIAKAASQEEEMRKKITARLETGELDRVLPNIDQLADLEFVANVREALRNLVRRLEKRRDEIGISVPDNES